MGQKSKMLVIRSLVIFTISAGILSCTTANPPVKTTTGATKTKKP
jgi:hypothetical protein